MSLSFETAASVLLFLGEHGHALCDAGDGLLGYLASLAAAHEGVHVQPGTQGLVLLEA